MNSVLNTPDEFFTSSYSCVDKDHGRLLTRTVEVATAYDNEFKFPHIKQYAVLNQTTEFTNGKMKPREAEFAIVTSLSAEQCSPEKLVAIFQEEWTIENRIHYVRDDAFQEDRCRIRTGNAPMAMATLRNLAIGIIRLLGLPNVKEAIRHFSYNTTALFQGFGYALTD